MQSQPEMAEAEERRDTVWRRWRERVANRGARLRPSPGAWRGATLALAVAALLLWLWATVPQMTSLSLASSLQIAGLNLLVAPLLALGLLLLLRLLAAPPPLFRWTLYTAVILLVTLGAGPTLLGWLLAVALLLLAVTVAGGAAGSLLGGGWRRRGWRGRLVSVGALVAALALLGGGAAWLLSPGSPPAALPATVESGAPVAPLDLPDPSERGPYPVLELTYGSGRDLHRPEYGAGVTLTTAPVDGSKIVGGWQGGARARVWGFDATTLPLNGRVWYPDGDGRFPLVLIAHGNSAPDDFSDRGFAYLGELLASRGFIVASVDQNFLNTGILDRMGGISGANAARAWLLLEHLRVWHEWDDRDGNPFSGKVDTGHIALIGHSRGGEAVALAAAFNRMQRFPDDATLRFDYGYGIRSLVALAPSDAQYMPAGEKVQLQDINYLTLHGSHDADVTSFAGLDQYHRVTFSGGPWFKVALYLYRANHSHFNTQWDHFDVGEGLAARFINTAALIPAEAQRQVARVTLSAFLEATLHDGEGYRPLFHDPRRGAAWLPDTLTVARYADAATLYLSRYEEDLDPATTTLDGGRLEGERLARWEETHLPRRTSPGDNRVARLAWARASGEDAPRYTLTLPEGGLPLTASSVLRFDIADGDPLPTGSESPLDLTIEVEDHSGNRARLPLSHIAPLQPPLRGQYLKLAALHNAPLSEPILQSYSLSLSTFAATGAGFDPGALAALTFLFDNTAEGTIFLDNIGIAPGD